jgi:hypothetical protein
MSANQYEMFDVASMLATDDCTTDLVALSRVSSEIMCGCHEETRAHLARSEARIIADATCARWMDEKGFCSRYCDRPAIVALNGIRAWRYHGVGERKGVNPSSGLRLPTIIYSSTWFEWWSNGHVHRDEVDPETGLLLPAAIEGGSRDWYINGERHRDEIDRKTGPEGSGTGTRHLPSVLGETRFWHRNGNRHRTDVDSESGTSPKLLPAVIYADGTCEWWIDGVRQEM